MEVVHHTDPRSWATNDVTQAVMRKGLRGFEALQNVGSRNRTAVVADLLTTGSWAYLEALVQACEA